MNIFFIETKKIKRNFINKNMDSGYDNYYIALIIIYIITIAIGIALSFYFIFLPAQRIETQFDTLQSRGLETLNNLNRLINTSDQLSNEILEDTCNSIIYVANTTFGTPFEEHNQGCILNLYCVSCNPLIPSVCAPFLPTNPGCTC